MRIEREKRTELLEEQKVLFRYERGYFIIVIGKARVTRQESPEMIPN